MFLIPIIQAILGAAVRVGVRVATAAARGAVKVSRYTMKVAKGSGSKRSRQEKDDGSLKISKHEKWMNCVRKKGP